MESIPFMALPFIFLPTGLIIGIFASKKDLSTLKKFFSLLFDSAFYALLFMLGMNLTLDKEVRNSMGEIGVTSFLLFLFATIGSILFVYIFYLITERRRKEDTVEVEQKEKNINFVISTSQGGRTVMTIIGILGLGGIVGLFNFFSIASLLEPFVEDMVSIILIFLYLAAGCSAGENYNIFYQTRKELIKILLLPFVSYIGSLIGGVFFGWLFHKPFVSVILPATGMGYYSVTSAFCFQTLGPREGSIAFLTNVFREIFTIATVPFLARVNRFFPTAAGGATTMDVSLAPIIKVQGINMMVIPLFSGIVLSFLVPVMLPILYQILK
ncbi:MULTISPECIES: lysine exporter LysO family protein [Caldanaerobacter]|uniref:lysine exporter LysO family protein n=1 Tax=Caldanaerobacter TaxID=249529 RepID=UPI000AEC5C6B|nr:MULTISPECIES: lysine exporter LysO family protein [Caldanaerobacter]MDI3517992.1 hypothetical protein [Caldanaerobacter sp.]MDK2793995.1 hypothetical protein [Caldanaerobacter sp.]